MTQDPDLHAGPTAAATLELARLNEQVAAMRAVLVGLLQDVVRGEQRLDQSQARQLLEANENLLITALGAKTDAESAHGLLDEVSRVAGLDPLTGLPNRALLLDRLASAIANAKRHGNRVALLFLDLDRFKQINDCFGHAVGDKALELVADALSSLVRETDTVSRHGGDEFLILLAEVSQASDAALIAEKVNATLGSYGQIDGHAVRLSASIGISVYPEDGQDADTLINHADAAMYRAKAQSPGGSSFHPFRQERASGTTLLPAQSLQSERRQMSYHEVTLAEHELRNAQLCEANEQLVLAALGARQMLATEQARRH